MRQIVCLSGSAWGTAPSRTQQLMARLRDTQVLFFQPAADRRDDRWRKGGRQVRPEVILYTLPPIPSETGGSGLFPFRARERAIQFIQAKLEQRGFREPVLWCSTPAGAEYLDSFAWRGLIYDCFQEWPAHMRAGESELASQADVVFAASPLLSRRMERWNDNVALLPYGCNYPMFARDCLPCPDRLAQLHGPILGFSGTLWADLDLEPLFRIAKAHVSWHFVLLGNAEGNPLLPRLLTLRNVQHFGFIPPLDLPEYIAAFDVCLHFLRLQAAGDVLPPRLFEYLAAGKPVAAMLRPEQAGLFSDVVYSAHTTAELERACADALTECDLRLVRRRRAYGEAACWSHRAAAVEQILKAIGF